MPKINYVGPDGTTTIVDAPEGTSVMAAAVAQGIDGIVGECGGNLMCATCHVYVHPDHVDKIPPVDDEEDAMLDCTESPRTDRSRLSCQLQVSEDRDGLVVYLPERQTP